MGVRTYEPREEERAPAPPGPGLVLVALVAAAVLLLLLANGRPAGVPDVRGLVAGFRPVLAALAGSLVEPDELAVALAGKLAASAFAALAAAFLFAAVARRRSLGDAAVAAFLLALGSSLWAASGALSSQAPAAAAVALAVLFLVRGEDEPAWSARAGLPLSLAVALQPATAALAAVAAAGVVVRRASAGPRLLAWAAPGLLLLAGQAAAGGLSLGLVPPGPAEALALLVSPARGALLFTPVALVAAVGLLRSLPYERGLAATLGLAFLAHAVFVLLVPDALPSWGTLALTPAWPLLFLYLPEGLDRTRLLGTLVAAASVAAQAIGAFGDDGRWDRLHRDGAGRLLPGVPWSLAGSPPAFVLRERVLRLAVPAVVGGRAVLREHPIVVGGRTGARVSFAGEGPRVGGAENTLGDVALLGGARVSLDRLELRAAGAGLFLRVREGARPRRLELRVAGRGRGTLAVGEGGFWNPVPRTRAHPVAGDFRLRQAYHFPESGGADLRLTLSGGGTIDLRTVALVPPGEPENVIRLTGE